MAKIKTLKDSKDETIYPVTISEAFLDANGNPIIPQIEEKIKDIKGADGKSAYQFAQEAGYTGTETEFGAKLNQTTFANPFPLTFTGAASATYDGSSAVMVDLPSGTSTEFREIYNKTLEEDVSNVIVDLPNLTKLKILVYGHQILSDGSETSTKQASVGVFFALTGIKEFKTVYVQNMISAYNRDVASLIDCEIDKQRNTIVGLVRCQQDNGQSSGLPHSLLQTFGNFPDGEDKCFTKINIAAQWNFKAGVGNVGRFAAGTKIKIYGA